MFASKSSIRTYLIFNGAYRDPGKMKNLSERKECARLCTKEEIPHAEHIFVNTTRSIRKNVRRQMFLSTIGRSHGKFGK
jgi:hypothetical protein